MDRVGSTEVRKVITRATEREGSGQNKKGTWTNEREGRGQQRHMDH